MEVLTAHFTSLHSVQVVGIIDELKITPRTADTELNSNFRIQICIFLFLHQFFFRLLALWKLWCVLLAMMRAQHSVLCCCAEWEAIKMWKLNREKLGESKCLLSKRSKYFIAFQEDGFFRLLKLFFALFNVLCNVWSVVGTPNSSKCSGRAQADEQNFIVSIGGKRIASK